MSRPRAVLFALPLLVPLLAGCVGGRQLPVGDRPTDVDPELAKASYWYAQPASERVMHDDFAQLWEAARRAARDSSYTIDRADYRGGVLTTDPLVSKQVFELWRGDVPLFQLDDHAESTLATVRRTVRFEFEELADGAFAVVPKVLVERYSFAERRVTSPVRYHEAFGRPRPIGAGEFDDDYVLPETYWFADRRDAEMEAKLAARIRGELRHVSG